MEFSIRQKEKKNKGRFYFEKAGEKVAEVHYRMEGDRTLVIERTEIIPSFQHTGTGRELVDRVLSFAESEKLELRSECDYFSHQMEKM